MAAQKVWKSISFQSDISENTPPNRECHCDALCAKIDMWHIPNIAGRTYCAPDANWARSGAQNLCDAPDFSGAQILFYKKEKNEKIIVSSKHYRKHQCTCNILMFIYLMASKMLYLLLD